MVTVRLISRSTPVPESATVEFGDPRAAFVLLLDLERRRRAGESIPCVRLEVPEGTDARLFAAIERHLPWISVQVLMKDVVDMVDMVDAHPRETRQAFGDVGMKRESVPLISSEELAMLFDSSETRETDG